MPVVTAAGSSTGPQSGESTQILQKRMNETAVFAYSRLPSHPGSNVADSSKLPTHVDLPSKSGDDKREQKLHKESRNVYKRSACS